MAERNAHRRYREQSVRDVRCDQSKGCRDLRSGGLIAAGLEQRRLRHDPNAVGQCDFAHRGRDPGICHDAGADSAHYGKEQYARRCMLIARTFKSSLLQRWSAHLWQNGMTQAPV